MFRCDQITKGEPCPYCGAPAQRDEIEPEDDQNFDRNIGENCDD